MSSMQHLVASHVVHHDMDQVVEVTCHKVAAKNFRSIADRPLEGLQSPLILAGERDLHKHVGTQAHRVWRDQSHVAVDETVLLHPSDSTETGRRRKVNRLGQVHVGYPTVHLEMAEDGTIYGI